MAFARAEKTSNRLMIVVLIVVLLLLTPLASCRPVPSGWDLSTSTGSSDTKLWREFSTRTQAISYHRLLLELEKSSRRTETVSPDGQAEKYAAADVYAEDELTTMDYANPRSNASGSSDDLTPPLP